MNRMTYKELREWMLYYTIEPFGEGAENRRFAVLCTLFQNANVDKKHKQMSTLDFIKFFEHYEGIKAQPFEEQLNIMKSIARSANKRDEIEKNKKPSRSIKKIKQSLKRRR